MPFDGTNYETPVTNPVTALLEQAWSLIDKHQKWCRGHFESLDGRRLCSIGALQVAAVHRGAGTHHTIALILLGRAINLPATAITWFNDRHSHAEVAAAWQRAIAMSRNLP